MLGKRSVMMLGVLLPCCAIAAEPAMPKTEATDTTGPVAEDAPVDMPVIEVVGTPEQRSTLAGSALTIERESLNAAHVFTTAEALRKAGVHVRDEEGFGLRPNIGIRGLNPTRTTKTLLLEDGIPLAYAPYGDNASYYHPPVDRFDRIELLKGSAQNLYGPQTIGGVINYITPAPPADFGGAVALTGGNRDYFNGHGSIGGRGMRFDYVRKQGDGSRDNIHSDLNDVNYKAVLALGAGHALTARANYYSEDSQVPYTGLTDAEYANFGAEYNPFKNDKFETNRQGVSFTHELSLGKDSALLTNLYSSRFNRYWWRQSSTTTDITQCGATNPSNPNTAPECQDARDFRDARLSGTAVDPDSLASNQGRLREYYTYGVEPRLRVRHGVLGGGELESGLRVHYETQDRVQKNGGSPAARDGLAVERNERDALAYAAFVQNRFDLGSVSLTPGLRVEHVRYERRNLLTGAEGDADVTGLLPSFGAVWTASEAVNVFAGVHKGFAPPRTEDIINGSGVSVDLEAEESWNTELGVRAKPTPGLALSATAFRNDFSRQISVGSIAGGGVPLATGKTLYEGLELQGRADFGRMIDSAHSPFFELAYTWLPTADQETALTRVDTGAAVAGSKPGNRQPYAPENLLTATLGYAHPSGFDARIESVFVDDQFADFGNTQDAAANGNGQFGKLPRYTVWNAAVNYRFLRSGFGLFVTGKNIFDKVYIADRTRGILPGTPRLVQAGVEYAF